MTSTAIVLPEAWQDSALREDAVTLTAARTVATWGDAENETADAAAALLTGGKSPELTAYAKNGFDGETADADRSALLAGVTRMEQIHGDARNAAYLASAAAAYVLCKRGPKDTRPGTISKAEFARLIGYSEAEARQRVMVGQLILTNAMPKGLTVQDVRRIASKMQKPLAEILSAGGKVTEQRAAVLALAAPAKAKQDEHTESSKTSTAPVETPAVPATTTTDENVTVGTEPVETPASGKAQLPDREVSLRENVRRFVEIGADISAHAGVLTSDQVERIRETMKSVLTAIRAAESKPAE